MSVSFILLLTSGQRHAGPQVQDLFIGSASCLKLVPKDDSLRLHCVLPFPTSFISSPFPVGVLVMASASFLDQNALEMNAFLLNNVCVFLSQPMNALMQRTAANSSIATCLIFLIIYPLAFLLTPRDPIQNSSLIRFIC